MATPPRALAAPEAAAKPLAPRHTHRHAHQSLRPSPAPSAADGGPSVQPIRSFAGSEGDSPPSAVPSAVALPAGFPSHITMNVNITTSGGLARPVVNSAQLVYDARGASAGGPSASAGGPSVLVPVPAPAKKRKSKKSKDHQHGNNAQQPAYVPEDAAAFAVPVAMAASPSSSSSASSSASSSSSASAAPAPVPKPSSSPSSPFEKLNTLKLLLDCGHLTADEYQERKTQIINEMTGTSTERKKKPSPSSRRSALGVPGPSPALLMGGGASPSPALPPPASSMALGPPPPLQPIMKTVVPHPPPAFHRVRAERADKLSFDVDTLEWQSAAARVKIDLVPFATGQLRNAYYLQELSGREGMVPPPGPPPALLVAKFSIRHAEPSSYLSDVEMQAVCAHYAALYNEHEPPLKVYYARSWLLKLRDRGGLVCSVEEFLPGAYVKYSNNNGYVGRETSTTEERERNTPQAFSHFSFVASDFRLMIVDIQGVDDSYTDPQIHTADGRGFGAGNLGTLGMEKFLESHRCNEVCRWLGLRSINEQYKPGGTAAPAYRMPFGGAIKKSTNRITEERNTFSTSVTVSQAFGDGLTRAADRQQPADAAPRGLRHYERARSFADEDERLEQPLRSLGLPLKTRIGAGGGAGGGGRGRRPRVRWWDVLARLLCWCLAA